MWSSRLELHYLQWSVIEVLSKRIQEIIIDVTAEVITVNVKAEWYYTLVVRLTKWRQIFQ
jgi:hypothetical protein